VAGAEMAANRANQKRGNAAPAPSGNGRSALVWGSLAFCSILAVCGLIALQMGKPGSAIATARVNPTPPPAQPVIQKSPSQSEFEIARLNDAIRALAAERDRLSARVETLEQSVGDITASIARKPEPKTEAKPEAAPEPKAQSEAKPETKTEAKVEPKAELQPQAPAIQAPVVAERATAADARETAPIKAATPEKPKTPEAAKPVPDAAPKAAIAAEPPVSTARQAEAPSAPPVSGPTPQREQAPRVIAHQQSNPNTVQNPFFTALTSFMQREEKPAPRTTARSHRIERPGQNPQTAAAKPARKTKIDAPLPPPAPARTAAGNGSNTQIAHIMPGEAAKPASQSDITGATQTQFGIDLGGETSLDGLRARWTALQSKHGKALSGLRPLVRVREGSRPGTVELHLVAGPVANAATAARVCANLQSTGIACRASEYDGQRLPSR